MKGGVVVAKAGEILKVKTPTGNTVNLGSGKDWLTAILGSAFLLVTFGLGQKVANYADKKVTMVDASIKMPGASPVQNKPGKILY